VTAAFGRFPVTAAPLRTRCVTAFGRVA